MKLTVPGMGLVHFEGLTAFALPALRLVAYHSPDMALVGKHASGQVSVKLRDIDLTHLSLMSNHR